MDFAEEASLSVAQLIHHQGEAEERRATLLDQALGCDSLAPLLSPVVDQENPVLWLERALLDL